MSDDEVTYLVCSRSEPFRYYVLGSTHDHTCIDCGYVVAVAPDSMHVLAAGAQTICVPCARKRAADSPEVLREFLKLRPAAGHYPPGWLP